jgi:hypothetical protein
LGVERTEPQTGIRLKPDPKPDPVDKSGE